jgi:hypothetical protein
MKTGRDIVIAALLGGEEFGFATAPLVVSGCVMMRVCHLDTCPVGVATQNPELRAKFNGKPEFVETFFEYIADEVREILAELGFRTLQEAIGQVEYLDTKKAIKHWKASGLDLAPLLQAPVFDTNAPRRNSATQDHGLVRALDNKLIELSNTLKKTGTIIHNLVYKPIISSFNPSYSTINITRAIEAELDITGWQYIFEHVCHQYLHIKKPSIHSIKQFIERIQKFKNNRIKIQMKINLQVEMDVEHISNQYILFFIYKN